jgi:hypothetical protein
MCASGLLHNSGNYLPSFVISYRTKFKGHGFWESSPLKIGPIVCPETSVRNACNETNLIHYLSSVYSVTITLHVWGLLAAHHQEVTMYICNNLYVLYALVDCQLAWLRWNHSHHCYLLMMGN